MNERSHILPEHDVRPYSIAQLADRWGCSGSLVRKLINQGELQCFRIGNLIRVPAVEVARYEARVALPVPVPTVSENGEIQHPRSDNRRSKVMVHSSPRNIPRAPRRKPPIQLLKSRNDK